VTIAEVFSKENCQFTGLKSSNNQLISIGYKKAKSLCIITLAVSKQIRIQDAKNQY
jgi:hypothetical protein